MNLKQKRQFFLMLCVAVFSFNLFAATTINILSLNTWMIPIQGKIPSERAKLIGKNINEFDMTFFQESFTRKVRANIKNSASAEFNGLYVYQRGNVLGSGLYNLSKFKITKKAFMPFRNCRNIQCAASKGVLYMQVALPSGALIDTFNTHLQAYQKDAKIRLKQLKQTLKFIQSMNKGVHPILFLGDFNVIASTDEYKTLTNLLIDYKDVWTDLRPSDDGFTWNPYTNPWANIDEDESVQKQRIDYIFVKDGKSLKWSVLDAQIMFNHSYATQSGPMFLSDHFGISASLELSK